MKRNTFAVGSRTGHRLQSGCFAAAGVLSVCLLSPDARSQEVGQILPKAGLAIPAPVAPVRAPGLAPLSTLAPVQSSDFAVSAQFDKGVLTPQDAFDQGLLSTKDILRILTSGQRLTQDERNEELQKEMAHVLVDHAPQAVKEPQALPLGVRVALARYYSSVGDAQTVALAEALLRELDQKPKASDPWPQLWGVILLAQYHENAGHWQKAGETWERALGYQGEVMWWQAGVRIDAARAYKQTGTPQGQAKAKELYAQVEKQGDQWTTGMATHDQVQDLIGRKSYDEARKLLTRPIKGVGTEPMQALLLCDSGQLHYLSGAWAEARADNQTALQQFQGVSEAVVDTIGFKPIINMAQARLSWSERWLKAPLVTDSNDLHLTVRQGQTFQEPVKLSAFIRSPRLVALEVTTNNEGVKARVEGKGESNEYFSQQEVVLEVQPQRFTQTTEVQVKVNSPQLVGATLTLPLQIEVQKAVEVSPSSLFFGEVEASKSTSATFELTAPMPFRILSVTPDNPALKVEADNKYAPIKQPLARYTLRVKFTPPSSYANQFYTGTLRVTTDVPSQEVIEVSYAARLK